jgi:Ni/Fe-hydrogenase subunit HybB-like protein
MPEKQKLSDLYPPPAPPPVMEPGHTFASITDKIAAVVLSRKMTVGWLGGFLIAFTLTNMLVIAILWLFFQGVGVWGVNQPVAWGFAIVNFVWWVGIGHAGTLISAILLLLRQSWRNAINRFAEAMTLFAVMQAGVFPAIHVGRPWVVYWVFPYPSTMGVWPQFRSALVWDVFAVSTYFTVSALFWYLGLVPDLGTMRDRATNPWIAKIYGVLSFGWRGSARHWARYESLYLLMGGLATPLVLSVHTVVSFDFAIALVPGWHETIFPPFFVAGAIYSGFAMVLVLAIPIRAVYGLEDLITARHLDNSAKVMLATGLIVGYGYVTEIFFSWYSGNAFDMFMTHNRIFGPYGMSWKLLILCNLVIPQILWLRKVRYSPKLLFLVSLVVLVGMWLERFVIVVVSLSRDFLVSSWGHYTPTRWDIMTFVGTIGFFVMLMYLFLRLLPAITIFEVRQLLPQAKTGAEAHD